MIDRSLNWGRHLIRDFLTNKEFNSVLDIGAGNGDDLLIAKDVNPDASLYAIECYKPLIKVLESKGINVSKINIETERLPFDDNSMDIVIVNQVLEHTKEIFWIFHEITRVLAVGGKVIVGVPNLASLHNRLLLLAGRQPTQIKNNSAHIRGYTKGDIINFVDQCFPGGYKINNFAGSNFYPFPPKIAKPLAKFFPSMAWGIFLELEKVIDYHKEFIDYPTANKLETNFNVG